MEDLWKVFNFEVTRMTFSIYKRPVKGLETTKGLLFLKYLSMKTLEGVSSSWSLWGNFAQTKDCDIRSSIHRRLLEIWNLFPLKSKLEGLTVLEKKKLKYQHINIFTIYNRGIMSLEKIFKKTNILEKMFRKILSIPNLLD